MKTSVSISELVPVIRDKVACGGTAELTVPGHSMSPTLIHRVSRVRLSAPSDIRRGDMVFYCRDNGVYVLHRVVKVCGDGTYAMCGDAQLVLEYGIRNDQIIAKVTEFARRKRWRSSSNAGYKIWWHLLLAVTPVCRFVLRGFRFLKRKTGKQC